jgi:hypothetical protein
MKGTLFSADFVKDTTGNLRLLELNTDTSIGSGSISNLDFTELISTLSSSNITELHAIHKPNIHKDLVIALSESVDTSGLDITFIEHEESQQTIYPTTIEDADDKFILRLAYDESAIFDSTYCKQKDELLNIFIDNSDTGSVAEYYSNEDGTIIDNLSRSVNSSIVPDLAIKNIDAVTSGVSFYKVEGTGSVEENVNSFLNQLETGSLVLNYYDTEGGLHKSYRSYNIIYGSNLDIINLGNLESTALFEKPTSISVDESGKVDDKHFFEFSTKAPLLQPSDGFGGIFEEEQITDESGNPVSLSELVIGNKYQSYFVSGSPDTDNALVFSQWTHEGSEFPSGSYVTSSVLINSIQNKVNKNVVVHIQTADSASFRATGNQHLLVYDTIDDNLTYKTTTEIDDTRHQFVKLDGTLSDITSNDIEVLEGEHYTYQLDFEEVDTYILHEGGLNIKIVAHNACFPAGTEITLENGDVKNIEDIQEGDSLVSYDIDGKEFTSGRVSKVNKSIQEDLVELQTESGEVLKSTLGHRIYTSNGWRDAKDLRDGDILLNSKGEETKISKVDILKGEFEVYHIMNVGNDHTYFANGLLVHNWSGALQPAGGCFIAGTKVSLPSGDIKNIEDILVGEEVLTYNEESGEQEVGKVGDLKTHEVTQIIRLTLDNENIINTTEEHPFFVEGKGWVKAGELQPLDVCKKVDGNESLISTVEVLEETHTVYNLLSVSENHNFYVNGILVHNKQF